MLTNVARCTGEIKSSVVMAQAALSKNTLCASILDLMFRNKLVNLLYLSVETWTFRTLDQKYLKSFEMWCWRRMEKMCWTGRVQNEELIHRVEEESSISQTINRRKEG